MSEFAIGTWKK